MDSSIRELKDLFRALADRSRLRIVEQLGACDEITVTELARRMKLSQPLISWHLGMLRRAGLVNTRREGRVVHCSLERARLLWCQSVIEALANGRADWLAGGAPGRAMGHPLNA